MREWLTNTVHSALSLIELALPCLPKDRALTLTLTRCASGDTNMDERRVIQIGVQGLVVLLGVVGFFQPDTPSERAYTGEEADHVHGGDGRDDGVGSGGDGSLGAHLLGAGIINGGTVEAGINAAAGSALRPNAEATASFASRLSFSWCSSILALGAKRALEQDDLYDLQINDRTAPSARRLVRNWARERRHKPQRASFWHAGHATFGRYFWATGLIELVRVIAQFAVPQLNRNLLE